MDLSHDVRRNRFGINAHAPKPGVFEGLDDALPAKVHSVPGHVKTVPVFSKKTGGPGIQPGQFQKKKAVFTQALLMNFFQALRRVLQVLDHMAQDDNAVRTLEMKMIGVALLQAQFEMFARELDSGGRRFQARHKKPLFTRLPQKLSPPRPDLKQGLIFGPPIFLNQFQIVPVLKFLQPAGPGLF